MIKITGIKEVQSRLDQLGVRVRFAAMKALDEAAESAMHRERAEINDIFDRPTPWIQRSVRMKNARLATLRSSVYIDQRVSSGSGMSQTAAAILRPHIFGGPRGLKGMERMLRDKQILPAGKYVAPAKGAKLDRYGNISGPQIVALLSAMKAIPERGFLMNRTQKSSKRAAMDYFVHRVGASGVPMGIWQRGRGARWARPVLQFISRPQYEKRFDYFGIARADVRKNFNLFFRRNLRLKA